MNRRNQFLTGAIAAILTFGTLTLTLGARHNGNWAHHGLRHHHGYGHNNDNCDGEGKSGDANPKDTERQNEL